MHGRLRFLLNRLKERLWVRPLLACLFSVLGVFLAKVAERIAALEHAPTVSVDSLENLLTILSASMLVIATFAVGSMVSSYASASSNATPRTFPLVVSDDTSQNALSSFIAAFIYSVVGIIAVKNSYYNNAGRFILFVLTIGAFVLVILTFVRWVDRIARLGRLGATIDKVEKVTENALRNRHKKPTLGCHPATDLPPGTTPITTQRIGYVQRIDVAGLQTYAEQAGLTVHVRALLGTFATPDLPLAHIEADSQDTDEPDPARIEKAFVIGHDRTFDEDPRFGLIVLSEIASRALSPAVNDPGTAIDITGTLVRLLDQWAQPQQDQQPDSPQFDRVMVPPLSIHDMFDDAFTGIARDGAGSVEVASRLQKAFRSLALLGNPAMTDAAHHHARMALARAQTTMSHPQDAEAIQHLAQFASP